MQLKDPSGQEINPGDHVYIPLALGQFGIGHVSNVSYGLGAPGTPQSIPCLFVDVNLTVPAAPNGVVLGAFKMRSPQDPPPILEG
jgi:hypothetical protein